MKTKKLLALLLAGAMSASLLAGCGGGNTNATENTDSNTAENTKTIDVVWNGMTLTDEVTSAMECTNAYCNNAQVVIVPSDVADQYQDVDSVKGLSFAV